MHLYRYEFLFIFIITIFAFQIQKYIPEYLDVGQTCLSVHVLIYVCALDLESDFCDLDLHGGEPTDSAFLKHTKMIKTCYNYNIRSYNDMTSCLSQLWSKQPSEKTISST